MQFKNPFKRWEGNTIFETIKVIVISLIIIIPIRTYLMEPFYVKGSSMEPNFYTYDYLLISKLKYRISEPDRGNIVVAKFSEKKPYVIKPEPAARRRGGGSNAYLGWRRQAMLMWLLPPPMARVRAGSS